MEELHRAVSRWLQRFAISRDAPVLAAVSGGGDSVALLHVLARIGQRLGVAHVHHGLRGAAADADLAFVEAMARAAGLLFHARRVEVGSGRPGSWEARARAARYAALEELRSARGYHWIATAHSRDDQAETVLLRAARGTRLEGLCGIEPLCRERRLLRPLLELRAGALRQYLRTRSLAWREDESNRDPRRARSRLRHAVLPELEAMQRGAVEHLAALADQARELRQLAQSASCAWIAQFVEEAEGGRWICSAALHSLELAARREVLGQLLRSSCPAAQLRSVHLARAVEFTAAVRPGRRLSLPGGCVLLCDRDAFWLGPAPGPDWPQPFEIALQPGRELWLPERGLRLYWQRPAVVPGHDALRVADESASVQIRSPRAGDQIVRGGRPLSLERALQRARCSLRQRRRAAVVANDRSVLWIAGLPALCQPDPRELHSSWELRAERVSGPPSSC